MLLKNNKTLNTSLPAQGIVTLMQQKKENRYVNHLLYASPVKRGQGIEIIEDILPIYDIKVDIEVPEKVKKVYFAPEMKNLDFEYTEGRISYKIEKLECHSMVVIEY